MSIKHIILCIEFVFLAVQIIMAGAAYKSPLKYGKTAKIVNILGIWRGNPRPFYDRVVHHLSLYCCVA